MSPTTQISVTEEDIQAYIDGQIDPDTELAGLIEAYLAACPEARERVRTYRAQKEAIKTRYRHILAEPVPDSLHPETLREAMNSRRQHRASASIRVAAALFVVCGTVLFVWTTSQDNDRPLERFADRVSTHLTQPHETDATGPRVNLQSLSALGGTPDLSPEGLQMVGARAMDNGDMYETKYRDQTGRELQLFVAPDPQRHDNLFSRTEDNGRKVVYLQQGPLMYALTGDFSQSNLEGLAHKAIERLSDGPHGDLLAHPDSRSAPSPDRDALTAAHDPALSATDSEGLKAGQSRLDSGILDLQNEPSSMSQ